MLSKDWNKYGDKLAVVDGMTGQQNTFNDYYERTASISAAFYNDMKLQKVRYSVLL